MDFNFNEKVSFNQSELNSTFEKVKWKEWDIDIKKMNKYYLEVIMDNIKLWLDQKEKWNLNEDWIKLIDSVVYELNKIVNSKGLKKSEIEYRTGIKLTKLKKIISNSEEDFIEALVDKGDWILNNIIVSKSDFDNGWYYVSELDNNFKDVTQEFEDEYQKSLEKEKKLEIKEETIKKEKEDSNPFFDEMFNDN